MISHTEREIMLEDSYSESGGGDHEPCLDSFWSLLDGEQSALPNTV